MTKQELSMYTVLKGRIDKLNKEISELQTKEIEIVAGKVKGSMKEHPYIETRIGVQMEEPIAAGKIDAAILKRRKEIDKLVKRTKDIEDFINGIDDVFLKTIFEYKYIENLSQAEIGEKVNLDRSRISRKISDYLKNAHKAHK